MKVHSKSVFSQNPHVFTTDLHASLFVVESWAVVVTQSDFVFLFTYKQRDGLIESDRSKY